MNCVVSDNALHDEAMTYYRKLANLSRGSLSTMKRLARKGIETPLTDGIGLELDLATKHLVTDDVSEGLAAFQDRRDPKFA